MGACITGGVHNAGYTKWDETRRAQLIQLLEEGKTATDIGAHFGVSRNVIIGKLDRDRTLPRLARNSGGQKGEGHRKAKTREAKPALPATVSLSGGAAAKSKNKADIRSREDQVIASRVRARLSFERGDYQPPSVAGYKPERWREGFEGQQARVRHVEKLESTHCKFPLDLANGQTGFCGDTREGHSPYCTDHAKRCFNPQSAAMRKRFS